MTKLRIALGVMGTLCSCSEDASPPSDSSTGMESTGPSHGSQSDVTGSTDVDSTGGTSRPGTGSSSDAADSSEDGTSITDDAGTTSDGSSSGGSSTSDASTSGSSTSGSSTSGSSTSGSSTSDDGGPLVPLCPDEIDPPAALQGSALAVQTWGPQSFVWSFAMDDAGAQVLGGVWTGTFTIDGQSFDTTAGDEDAFVAVLEPDGSLRWFVPIAGTDPAQVMVDIGPSGDVHVVGNFDNQLVIEGTEIGPGPVGSGRAVFFAALDGDTGALEWAHTMTNSAGNSGWPLRVSATPDGGMVAAASAGAGTWSMNGEVVITSFGSADYLVRFDSTGEVVWDARIFGTDGATVGVEGIELDGDTAVVAVSSYNYFGYAGVALEDVPYESFYDQLGMVVRYDAGGEIEDTYFPPWDLSIRAIDLGPCGDMVFGGDYASAFNLGTGAIMGSGAYVARRAPDGEMRWVVPLDLGEEGYVAGVVFDAAGHSTWQTFDGTDLRIIRLDPYGELLWDLGYPSVWNYALVDGLAGDGLERLAIGSSYYDGLAIPGLPPAPGDGENHAYLLDITP